MQDTVEAEITRGPSDRLRPQITARGEGTPMWFLGSLTYIRASGETTRGAFALVEQLIPAGFATPFHVHHAEDESFYIIEGQLTFFCEGRKVQAGPGGYIFGPRGIPHGFRVDGNTEARVLILATPGGGFDKFVAEIGIPAPDPNMPPVEPPDMQKLIAVAAAHNIEILGPLPD